MKRILKTLLLLASCFGGWLPVAGQGEDHNWVTGSVIINFPGGASPSAADVTTGTLATNFYPTPNATIVAQEGVASISGAAGNLLFYANGEELVEAGTHTVIATGLPGSWSGMQTATILPRPGHCGDYVLITNDDRGSGPSHLNGINYYYFNGAGIYSGPFKLMTTNALGTLQLPADHSEAIGVVPHPNCRDFWLITHSAAGNTWMVYLLDDIGVRRGGVADIPFVTPVNLGLVITPPDVNRAGVIKASRAGDRIAMTSFSGGIQLLDFDNATGTLSNPIPVTAPARDFPNTPPNDFLYNYGAEFSLNGDFVYFSLTGGADVTGTHGMVFGYDILAGVNLPDKLDHPTRRYGALQRGPDGEIYFTSKDANNGTGRYLGVINNSNSGATSYNDELIDISVIPAPPGQTAGVDLGLPAIYDYPEAELAADPQIDCELDITICEVGLGCDGSIPMDYNWDFGDGTTATTQTPCVTHTFPEDGDYTVTMTYDAPYFCTPSAVSIDLELQPCCPVIGDFNYAVDEVIDEDIFWQGQVLIGDEVTVTVTNGAILDITNTDVLFEECGRIVLEDGAMLRANNSVFRPCIQEDVWQGITFNNDATGIIHESTFKNAIAALSFTQQTTSARITNNLFANCKVGVVIDGTAFTEAITGNTFMLEDSGIDYEEFGCFANLPTWLGTAPDVINANTGHLGIGIRDSDISGKISQNDFIHTEDLTVNPNLPKVFYGIFMEGAQAEITSNNFSGMSTSIFLTDIQLDEGVSTLIENNRIEANLGGNVNLGQIVLFGVRNVQVLNNQVSNSQPSQGLVNPGTAIVAQIVFNSRINANQISGFSIGIDAGVMFESTISENSFDKTSSVGIQLFDGGLNRIGCNTINMEQEAGAAATDRFGIRVVRSGNVPPPNDALEIHSNCIFETDVAIHVLNAATTVLNFTGITNNYLYNYRRAGVLNDGFSLRIGTAVAYAESGRNTFVSNHGGATPVALDLEVGSGTIDAFGNFGINAFTAGAVNVWGNDDFHSTAACGGHINFDDGEQFDAELCDRFYEDQALVFPAKMSSGSRKVDLRNFVLQVENGGARANEALLQLMLENWDTLARPTDLVLLDQVAQSEHPLALMASLLIKRNFWAYPLSLRKIDYQLPERNGAVVLGGAQISLFPTPVTDVLQVRFQLEDPGAQEIEVLDLMGRTVRQVRTDMQAGEVSLSLGTLRPGIYFVSIKHAAGGKLTKRFVKK